MVPHHCLSVCLLRCGDATGGRPCGITYLVKLEKTNCPGVPKIFSKKSAAPIDKNKKLCYNNYRKQKRGTNKNETFYCRCHSRPVFARNSENVLGYQNERQAHPHYRPLYFRLCDCGFRKICRKPLDNSVIVCYNTNRKTKETIL